MTITPYFQMGIHDIFEPNKADFSPMTDEFGIYARHIEQSITVNIRTHANNQLRRKFNMQPIELYSRGGIVEMILKGTQNLHGSQACLNMTTPPCHLSSSILCPQLITNIFLASPSICKYFKKNSIEVIYN